MTILGSDVVLKSSSRGNNTLLEVLVGFRDSFLNECSEPKFDLLFAVYSVPTA